MEWWQLLILILAGLLVLMFLRIPVAFAFLMVNIVAAYFLWQGGQGLSLLISNVKDSLTAFTLLPIPLFILMGEIMFHSRLAPQLVNAVDHWLGRVPGRLSLLAVGGGTLLSTLTASTMASTAILGSSLLPEMEQKKYKAEMSIGPILASGCLAALIPPSAMGVLLASMGKMSVSQFLIAIILPGLLLAAGFALYIIIRALFSPHLAPAYDVQSVPLKAKVKAALIYILPLSSLILLIIGSIFFGIASPTEAAALGVAGSFILALAYRTLSREVLIKAFAGSLRTTVMILMVVAASQTFSQILSFSGVTQNLLSYVGGLHFAPIVIVMIMLLLVIIMGTFMESLSILMIVIPIFFPIIDLLGFNPIWFGVLLLIAIEIGMVSPPFGLSLFVMKGVAPKGTTMGQIYLAGLPYIGIMILVMLIILFIPEIALLLPDLMRGEG